MRFRTTLSRGKNVDINLVGRASSLKDDLKLETLQNNKDKQTVDRKN